MKRVFILVLLLLIVILPATTMGWTKLRITNSRSIPSDAWAVYRDSSYIAGTWYDLTSNHRNMVQSSVDNRPTLASTGLYFGADDWMPWPENINLPFTIVTRWSNLNDWNGNANYKFLIWDSTTVYPQCYDDGTSNGFFPMSNGARAYLVPSLDVTRRSGTVVYVHGFTATNGCYVKEPLITYAGYPTGGNATSNIFHANSRFGNRNGTNEGARGPCKLLVVIPRELTDAEVANSANWY